MKSVFISATHKLSNVAPVPVVEELFCVVLACGVSVHVHVQLS